MTQYAVALNEDVNGVKTSAEWDGAQWVFPMTSATDTSVGEIDDAAVTNPASDSSLIASNKGILSLLAALNVDVGEAADAAVTNPASSASSIAALKGILTGINSAVTALGYSSGAATPVTIKTSALATNLVVKASAGKLRSIVGYTTLAQFIQIHNATSLPADATAPHLSIPVEANKPFSIDFGHVGLPCTTGIVICNSTTGPTKTIGAADTFVTAVYQ